MAGTIGKSLSMVLNVLRSRDARIEVGGSFSFGTPYGVFHVPLQIGPEGLAGLD